MCYFPNASMWVFRLCKPFSFRNMQCAYWLSECYFFFFINSPCKWVRFYVWLRVLLRRESSKGCRTFGCLHLDGLPFVYYMYCAIIRRHLHQACWHVRISKSSARHKLSPCLCSLQVSEECNVAQPWSMDEYVPDECVSSWCPDNYICDGMTSGIVNNCFGDIIVVQDHLIQMHLRYAYGSVCLLVYICFLLLTKV